MGLQCRPRTLVFLLQYAVGTSLLLSPPVCTFLCASATIIQLPRILPGSQDPGGVTFNRPDIRQEADCGRKSTLRLCSYYVLPKCGRDEQSESSTTLPKRLDFSSGLPPCQPPASRSSRSRAEKADQFTASLRLARPGRPDSTKVCVHMGGFEKPIHAAWKTQQHVAVVTMRVATHPLPQCTRVDNIGQLSSSRYVGVESPSAIAAMDPT